MTAQNTPGGTHADAERQQQKLERRQDTFEVPPATPAVGFATGSGATGAVATDDIDAILASIPAPAGMAGFGDAAITDVPSISDSSRTHRVTLHANGFGQCDCDGYRYRHTCSHVDRLRTLTQHPEFWASLRRGEADFAEGRTLDFESLQRKYGFLSPDLTDSTNGA